MKNLKIILLSFFSVLFILSSCTEEAITYSGDSFLHFNKGTKSTVAITLGTGNQTVDINYGTISAVSSSTTVKLVVDTEHSTAVEGVDFTIMNNPDELASGENSGVFTVRLLENGATLAPKSIVFRLTSPSVTNAMFDQIYTLTYSLACPSNLQGNYTYTTVNYGVPGSGTQTTPLTGTGSLTVSAQGGYNISDAAFGVYIAMWGSPYNVAVTGVRLVDSCGKLSFDGANADGDTWTISNVVVNGSNLTFDWITSYSSGEYGTTTLTRTDGTNWPSNLH